MKILCQSTLMRAVWVFYKWSEMRFNWVVFCNSINVRYSLLIFCVIYAKGSKARINPGYVNVFFTICRSLKMLFSHFQKFDFSNIKLTFATSFMKKNTTFMTDKKVLLLVKTLPCGDFWQYHSGTFNVLRILHRRPLIFFAYFVCGVLGRQMY